MGHFQPAILTYDPNVETWGIAQAGVIWFNKTVGVLRFWNGYSVRQIPMEGEEPPSEEYLFEEDFEANNWVKWSGISDSPVIQSSVKYAGTYAALFNAWGQDAYKTLTANPVYVDGRFRISALPDIGKLCNLIRLTTAAGYRILDVYLYRSGDNYGIQTFEHYPNSNWKSYVFSLAVDTWYRIKAKFYQHASSGEYRVWLEGTERITSTGLNTSDGALGNVRIGTSYLDYTTNLYVDNVIMDGEDIT